MHKSKNKTKCLSIFLCEQRHVVTAKLVRAVTSSCLIQRLKAHGYRNPDHSRALSKFFYEVITDLKISGGEFVTALQFCVTAAVSYILYYSSANNCSR